MRAAAFVGEDQSGSRCRPDPLRDLLSRLQQSNQLLRIVDEVDADYEICAFCRLVADAHGPALLFERITGHDMPALANLFGTRERIAIALGVPVAKLASTVAERLKRRIAPVQIAAEAAPCQDIVWRGDEVDLGRLPIPVWNVGDGGKYITAGINIGAHPRWGRNAGIYRNMVRSRNELFAQIAPDHQQRLFYQDIGKGCPLAIALGVDPLLYLAAGSDFPLGDYELDVAGALRGEPLRVVKAVSIDLDVPADAEIVVEAEYTGEMADEGPFNEFTGYQSERRPAPIWSVKAISMRRHPIMHLAFAGKPPNENVSFWRELEDALALEAMRQRFPAVRDVSRPAELARDFWGIVQIDSRYARPGLCRNVMLALTYLMPRLKYVVAVDEDIDIHATSEVFWAISTRVDPGHDTFLVPETATGPIDPSSRQPGVTSKLFIDATKKPHFRGVTSAPPDEALERARVKLDRMLNRSMQNQG